MRATTELPERIRPGSLSDLRWGLERESHRILRDGSLAPTAHPESLRPPRFTKDFAESQLEIVTPPIRGIDAVLRELERLTRIAQSGLDRERLWPFSMPPRLPDDDRIPIADFGPGEEARRARLYREGLALRYGKARQMICGAHVNVSLGPSLVDALLRWAPLTPEEASARYPGDGIYLRLARHLFADLPLFILLFGASPVRGGGAEDGPAATSYRNSPVGYARLEFSRSLSLDSVDAYLAAIRRGLRTQSETFTGLGLVRAGAVRQISTGFFQSDKEFYAPIRLRQALRPRESTLTAIARRGVGYLELRFLDVDPFEESGVSDRTLRLLHLFLLDAAFRPSARPAERALDGALRRAAGVALWSPARASAAPDTVWPELLRGYGRRLSSLAGWAAALDGGRPRGLYSLALGETVAALRDPVRLPAARLLRQLEASGTDWTTFGARRAQAFRSRARAVASVTTPGVEHALDHAGV